MSDMKTITFTTSPAPKHYRLRRTHRGGFELLGGFECHRQVDGEAREVSIEWRPLETLECGEEPNSASSGLSAGLLCYV
jgi:hypothetical protein